MRRRGFLLRLAGVLGVLAGGLAARLPWPGPRREIRIPGKTLDRTRLREPHDLKG